MGKGRAMKVFIIAGEPSGDRLGGALMAGLKSLRPDITFDGIGGTDMAAEGLSSRFDMSELSVMGIAEILPKYKSLMARINETAQAVIDAKPDVMITIDSPDFSLRVASGSRRHRIFARCIMSRPRSGPGVPGARKRWRGISIMCLRFSPSSRP